MDYRRELRRFQLDFGQKITPKMSVLFGQQYADALEKDPAGSQVLHLINDWRERLTPMAT